MSQSNHSGLNLDHLEALAKAAQISILRMGMNGRPNDYFALMNAMSPEAVLALIALARRAALANQPAHAGMSIALAEVTEKLGRMSAENLSLGVENRQLREQLAAANQPAPTVPAGDALRDELNKWASRWTPKTPNPAMLEDILNRLAHQPAPTVPAAGDDLLKSWPNRIWLQAGDTDEREEYETLRQLGDGITWADSSIDRFDVEYVRADLVAHQPAQEQAENIEADAYMFTCDEMERWQKKRAMAGLEIGTEGSLVDGIGWLYAYIEKLEAGQQPTPP